MGAPIGNRNAAKGGGASGHKVGAKNVGARSVGTPAKFKPAWSHKMSNKMGVARRIANRDANGPLKNILGKK